MYLTAKLTNTIILSKIQTDIYIQEEQICCKDLPKKPMVQLILYWSFLYTRRLHSLFESTTEQSLMNDAKVTDILIQISHDIQNININEKASYEKKSVIKRKTETVPKRYLEQLQMDSYSLSKPVPITNTFGLNEVLNDINVNSKVEKTVKSPLIFVILTFSRFLNCYKKFLLAIMK